MTFDHTDYAFDSSCHVIVFFSHKADEVEQHSIALEVDGFPTPTSGKVTGFDKTLTSIGLERSRLPGMYKKGDDTQATMIILLHGASRLSLDGFGSYILPVLFAEDQRDALYYDLSVVAAGSAAGHRLMTDAEKTAVQGRLSLPILCGRVSKPLKRFELLVFQRDIVLHLADHLLYLRFDINEGIRFFTSR